MNAVIDAPTQLIIVVKGTIFGYTIYGMYSHTIGPKLKEKTHLIPMSPIIIIKKFLDYKRNPKIYFINFKYL
jgi:hypothetical protein